MSGAICTGERWELDPNPVTECSVLCEGVCQRLGDCGIAWARDCPALCEMAYLCPGESPGQDLAVCTSEDERLSGLDCAELCSAVTEGGDSAAFGVDCDFILHSLAGGAKLPRSRPGAGLAWAGDMKKQTQVGWPSLWRYALLGCLGGMALACSAGAQKPAIATVLDNDERRHESFEATLQVLDENPDYVDELFAVVLRHPKTLDRLLAVTAHELERDEFARFAAKRLVGSPAGLKQTLIASLDEASDDPAALLPCPKPWVHGRSFRPSSSSNRMRPCAERSAHCCSKCARIRRRALRLAAIAENSDSMAEILAPNPNVVRALLKAFVKVGIRKGEKEISALAKALESKPRIRPPTAFEAAGNLGFGVPLNRAEAMPMKKSSRKLGLSSCFAIALVARTSCGGDSDGDAGTSAAGPNRPPEQTGSVCEVDSECFPEVVEGELLGEALCLTRVRNGYCTHTCEVDTDCCAVEGECKTTLPQVCSPFESAPNKMCLLSCEDADVEGDPDAEDANDFCQRNASWDFSCRSSGGGSENRKVCMPTDCGVGAACAADADCGDLSCVLGVTSGYCSQRDCVVNADCPGDSLCVTSGDNSYCYKS